MSPDDDGVDKPAHLTIRVLWVLVSDCETNAARKEKKSPSQPLKSEENASKTYPEVS